MLDNSYIDKLPQQEKLNILSSYYRDVIEMYEKTEEYDNGVEGSKQNHAKLYEVIKKSENNLNGENESKARELGLGNHQVLGVKLLPGEKAPDKLQMFQVGIKLLGSNHQYIVYDDKEEVMKTARLLVQADNSLDLQGQPVLIAATEPGNTLLIPQTRDGGNQIEQWAACLDIEPKDNPHVDTAISCLEQIKSKIPTPKFSALRFGYKNEITLINKLDMGIAFLNDINGNKKIGSGIASSMVNYSENLLKFYNENERILKSCGVTKKDFHTMHAEFNQATIESLKGINSSLPQEKIKYYENVITTIGEHLNKPNAYRRPTEVVEKRESALSAM